MTYFPPTTRPHHRRYSGYDYSRGAVLFATVSTEPRVQLFGEVREGKMFLSPQGEIVEHELKAAAEHFPCIQLFKHIVMPDHVHFRFRLLPQTSDATMVMGRFVGRFKQFSQWKIHQAGGPEHLWEKGWHDHLCLSREMIGAVDRYILNNPLKWWLMHSDCNLLHVREPLENAWLPHDVLWRGVGEFDFAKSQRLVALRVSRRVPSAAFPQLVEDCLHGAACGYVYVSTFFSPGERAVYRAVAERTQAPLVHLRADAIHWAYRPIGLETELFAARRLMILARMEATDDPARRADLLWLNGKAREIALGAGGKAIYAQVAPNGTIVYNPL